MLFQEEEAGGCACARRADQPVFDRAGAISIQGYLFALERQVSELSRHIASLEAVIAAQENELATRHQADDAAPPPQHLAASRPSFRSASAGPVLFRIAGPSPGRRPTPARDHAPAEHDELQ